MDFSFSNVTADRAPNFPRYRPARIPMYGLRADISHFRFPAKMVIGMIVIMTPTPNSFSDAINMRQNRDF